jgi:hypothetical protein
MANALRLLLAPTLAAALASCGGDGSSSASLDPAVANQLASASEDVAAALEQHRCAEPAVRELKRRASAGSVPAAVEREVRRVVERARISCPAAAPPATAPTPTLDEDEDDDGGRGRGHEKHAKHEKKHGHGRGHGKGDD